MKNKSKSYKERVKPTTTIAEPERKACRNCLKGKRLGLTNDILCREKGIVSADYNCPSHRYFIMDDFKKREFYRCCDCEFFALHAHESIPMFGVCDMFSVRECDGSARKACSKFVRRREFIA